jgi:hypothetical protein
MAFKTSRFIHTRLLLWGKHLQVHPVADSHISIPDPGRWHRLLDASTGHVADFAHEVIYRLKEANVTKWLFSSKLTVSMYLWSPITPERNTAAGLVTAPPVWELALTGF